MEGSNAAIDSIVQSGIELEQEQQQEQWLFTKSP
jgi:hypothetical protein